MSRTSDIRSDEFLKISDQFKLGLLTTESSHPVTAKLSEIAAADIPAALQALFRVDEDVVGAYARFAESGRARSIAAEVVTCLRGGGRLFFTGCGSTGRLSIQLVSIWRGFWERHSTLPQAALWAERALSVMAGGDFALIKAVEGFEDYTAFGRKQIADLGVNARDLVFAITEGGETSFVIGTAWQAMDAGARTYFVYNNPDAVLCEHVERSRAIICEPRIEKVNLTTGPMAITGSTRMQATSIQLCVLATVLEMALRELLPRQFAGQHRLASEDVPRQFSAALRSMHQGLASPTFCRDLAKWVELEERVYRRAGKVNYFADAFSIDVLTDTTERSPTYCTPPFRKADDPSSAESWAFLFVSRPTTELAWNAILRREPRCVEWARGDIEALLDPIRAARSYEVVTGISRRELLRFKVGLDGLPHRPMGVGDAAVSVVGAGDLPGQVAFFEAQAAIAERAGAGAARILVLPDSVASPFAKGHSLELRLSVPPNDFLIDLVARVGLKMVLNAVSTCTMVRLGRVQGNYMVWVVPSNLKLIDRATRYIQRLTSLDYVAANRLLFDIIEYVEPRMRAGQAYPPAVAMAVRRHSLGLTNEEAERSLAGD